MIASQSVVQLVHLAPVELGDVGWITGAGCGAAATSCCSCALRAPRSVKASRMKAWSIACFTAAIRLPRTDPFRTTDASSSTSSTVPFFRMDYAVAAGAEGCQVVFRVHPIVGQGHRSADGMLVMDVNEPFPEVDRKFRRMSIAQA
jgi:hypothetical protein